MSRNSGFNTKIPGGFNTITASINIQSDIFEKTSYYQQTIHQVTDDEKSILVEKEQQQQNEQYEKILAQKM